MVAKSQVVMFFYMFFLLQLSDTTRHIHTDRLTYTYIYIHTYINNTASLHLSLHLSIYLSDTPNFVLATIVPSLIKTNHLGYPLLPMLCSIPFPSTQGSLVSAASPRPPTPSAADISFSSVRAVALSPKSPRPVSSPYERSTLLTTIPPTSPEAPSTSLHHNHLGSGYHTSLNLSAPSPIPAWTAAASGHGSTTTFCSQAYSTIAVYSSDTYTTKTNRDEAEVGEEYTLVRETDFSVLAEAVSITTSVDNESSPLPSKHGGGVGGTQGAEIKMARLYDELEEEFKKIFEQDSAQAPAARDPGKVIDLDTPQHEGLHRAALEAVVGPSGAGARTIPSVSYSSPFSTSLGGSLSTEGGVGEVQYQNTQRYLPSYENVALPSEKREVSLGCTQHILYILSFFFFLCILRSQAECLYRNVMRFHTTHSHE